MYKSIYFKDREFATKEDLFAALKENQDVIISAKKSEIYKSCDKGQSVSIKSLDLLKFTEQIKEMKVDDNYYYFAVNSTMVLDNHGDLHVDGIWNKSVKEIQGKNYLVEDHELEVSKIIARKENIEIFTAKVPFSVIGKNYKGNTEILVYKVAKSNIKSPTIKEWLDSGDSIECSVRMQYITVLLAMDSKSPDDVVEKKNYDEYINKIANKSDYDYIPYFCIVKEAKNVRESSLVVFGSNSATGIIQGTKNIDQGVKTDYVENEGSKPTTELASTQNVEAEPITSTKTEPSIDTQEQTRKQFFINQLKN